MDTLDLHEKATQVGFAKLVGTSQPSIADRVKSGVLAKDGTVAEWLYSYCSHLRTEAAGRSGKAQEQLTQARIEESRENALEKKQRRLLAAGSLVEVADIQQLVLELPIAVRTQMLQAAEKIHEEIQAKYSITLEDADVYQPIRSALRHVANSAKNICTTFGFSGGGVDTETDSAN